MTELGLPLTLEVVASRNTGVSPLRAARFGRDDDESCWRFRRETRVLLRASAERREVLGAAVERRGIFGVRFVVRMGSCFMGLKRQWDSKQWDSKECPEKNSPPRSTNLHST